MLFNLTQSRINVNIKTNQAAAYMSGGFPIAAGWSGVYYPQNGSTTTFTNVTAPGTAVDGITTLYNFSYNPNNSFMNLFAVFPS